MVSVVLSSAMRDYHLKPRSSGGLDPAPHPPWVQVWVLCGQSGNLLGHGHC